MARIAKPWFYKQTGWWMAYVGGQKTKLAKGKGPTRKPLTIGCTSFGNSPKSNPHPDADAQQQTVAS